MQGPSGQGHLPGNNVCLGQGSNAQSSCVHNSKNWKASVCRKEEGQGMQYYP